MISVVTQAVLESFGRSSSTKRTAVANRREYLKSVHAKFN